MSLFERTKETAQKQGLTVAMVEKRAGLSENALYSWRKSSPKSENLQKVADVLKRFWKIQKLSQSKNTVQVWHGVN